MPAPKCDGGKDSRRWVGRRCYPKRQNRLERWRDGRKGMDGWMEGWMEGWKEGGERKEVKGRGWPYFGPPPCFEISRDSLG